MARCWCAALALWSCVACSKAHDASPPRPSATAARVQASGRALPAKPASHQGIALRVGRRIGKGGDALSATLYRYSGAAMHGWLWVARIRPGKARFELLPASRPRPLAVILKGHEPTGDYVAVNGGFYDHEKPMGLVVSRGKLVSPLGAHGGSGVFLVEGQRPAVVPRDDYRAHAPVLALQSVDRLVDHGRVLVRPRPDLHRDARSAVAIDADGAVLFAVAFDARAAFPLSDDAIRMSEPCTTTGPTLLEFAELLARDLGARFALNLDGGSSTAMRLRIGEARLDVIARRATINALVARPRDALLPHQAHRERKGTANSAGLEN